MYLKFSKNSLYTIGCFIFASVLYLIFIYPSPDMISQSGDSQSIWATITTFYTDDIASSYVLYKGFLSVYPYVWLYKLSIVFQTDAFFFIKIYQSILFGYLSGVGLPYLVQSFLSIRTTLWQRILLIVLLLWIWAFNTSLTMISVDLPSLVVLVTGSNIALRISKQTFKFRYLNYIYAGVVLGLGLCFSGQYIIATFCILLYIIIQTLSSKTRKNVSKKVIIAISVICIIAGFAPVKMYNTYFEKSFVDPMRQSGEWIPTGMDWIVGTAMHKMTFQKYGSDAMIQDNRGTAIIKELEGDNFDNAYNAIVNGAYPVNAKMYLGLIQKHPIDFISRWCNRLFLGMSPDDASRSVTHLFVNYTLIYFALFEIKKRCRLTIDIINAKSLIPLAFFSAVLIPCFLHVEMRYFIPLQGFVYAVAVLCPTLWTEIGHAIKGILECIKGKSLTPLKSSKFPYKFTLYFLFIVICFSHFAALYDVMGAIPNGILFTR